MALISVTSMVTGEPIYLNPAGIESVQKSLSLDSSGTEIIMLGGDPEDPYQVMEPPECICDMVTAKERPRFVFLDLADGGTELVRVDAIDRVTPECHGFDMPKSRVYIRDYHIVVKGTVKNVYDRIREA